MSSKVTFIDHSRLIVYRGIRSKEHGQEYLQKVLLELVCDDQSGSLGKFCLQVTTYMCHQLLLHS